MLEVKGGELVLDDRTWFRRHNVTGALDKITDPFISGIASQRLRNLI